MSFLSFMGPRAPATTATPIPHGGILVPRCTGAHAPVATPLCGAVISSRLHAPGSCGPRPRPSCRQHAAIAYGTARQPGPQEDGYSAAQSHDHPHELCSPPAAAATAPAAGFPTRGTDIDVHSPQVLGSEGGGVECTGGGATPLPLADPAAPCGPSTAPAQQPGQHPGGGLIGAPTVNPQPHDSAPQSQAGSEYPRQPEDNPLAHHTDTVASDGDGSRRLNGHAAAVDPAARDGAARTLPQLRLDFLDVWGKMQQGPGQPVPPQSLPQRQQGARGPRGGAGRRRRGASMDAAPRSRDERIRQLVFAAKTLVQVRLVVERHLPHMSAATAAIALSRLAGLAAATQRLRMAQQQGQGQLGEVAAAVVAEAMSAPDADGSASPAPSGTGAEAAVTETASYTGGQPATPPTAAASVRPPPGTLQVGLPAAPESAAALHRALAGSSSSGRIGRGAVASAVGAGVGVKEEGEADEDGSAEGSARVQRSCLVLMRRMLHHIALCMAPEYGGSAAAAPSAGPSSSAPSRPGPSGRHTSAPTASRFSPPDHRARVAGTVLATLARVGLRPSAQDSRALHAILEAARPDLFLATPAQLCRLSSSLPLLRVRPPPAWLDHLAAVTRSKMYAAAPLHLAAFVWALARLGHHPGDLWLHTLAQHLQRDRRLASASAGQLCEVLWALHRLDFTPDPDWRAEAAAAVQAVALGCISTAGRGGGGGGEEALTGSSSDADLANVGMCGRGGSHMDGPAVAAGGGPGSGVAGGRAAALGVVTRGGGGMSLGNSPAEVASLLLWAVRTGTAPGQEGMEACLVRLQPSLRSLRRVHLLRLLLALAEAGHRPSEAFMEGVLGCLQPKLPLLAATHLTQALLSISQLRFVPPQSWLATFLRASRSQLRYYTPAHVTATYQVFSGWQLRPPRSYLEALHAYMDGMLPQFTPRGLATVLHSMASLGVKPQRRWLVRALEVLADAAARSVAVGPAALTAETYSASAAPPPGATPAAQLGSPPARLSAAQQQHQMRQQQRAAVASALVMAVCSLRGVVLLDGAGGQAQGPAGASDALTLLEQGKGQGQGLSDDDIAAAGSVGEAVEMAASQPSTPSLSLSAASGSAPLLPPPPQLLPYELWGGVKALTDLCRELLDVMTAEQLARLVTALARVSFYPGRDFLAAHSRATARAGAQLLPADKEAVAECYGRLAGVAPLMVVEARRQADARQARSAVLVGADTWASE